MELIDISSPEFIIFNFKVFFMFKTENAMLYLWFIIIQINNKKHTQKHSSEN